MAVYEDLTAKLYIDVSDVEAGLRDLEKQMQSIQKKVESNNLARDVIQAKIDELKATQEELTKAFSEAQIGLKNGTVSQEEYSDIIDRRQSVFIELEKQEQALAKCDEKAKDYGLTMETIRGRAAELQQVLMGIPPKQEEATEEQQEFNTEIAQTPSLADAVSASFDRFARRLKTMMMRTFVFGVIMRALRALRSTLTNVIMADNEAAKSVAQLKAALLTISAPILNTVIPALTRLLQVLARVMTFVAQFAVWLFGTTLEKAAESAKSLYSVAGGYGAAADAAKDYKKELADFDDLHVLSSNEEQESNGGGGGSGAAQPDFSFLESIQDGLADWVKWAVTAGALALGLILAFSGHPIIGAALIAVGVAGLVKLNSGEKIDAWIKQNQTKIADGIAIAGVVAVGLGVLLLGFFPAIGIGLIALGITALIGSSLTSSETGAGQLVMDTQTDISSKVLSITGVLALGLGLIMLIFNPIVGLMLIGIGIASLIGSAHPESSVEDAGGALVEGVQKGILGKISNIWQWIKDYIFNPFIEGFKALFGISSPSKVMEEMGGYIIDGLAEGIKGIWDAVKGYIEMVITNIRTAFLTAWETIKTKFSEWKVSIAATWESLKTTLLTGIQNVRTVFSTVWAGIRNTVMTVISAIRTAFSSAWTVITTGARTAWQSIKSIFSTVASYFGNIFSNAWTAVKNVFSTGGQIFAGIKEGISSVFTSTVNHIISGINTVVAVPFNAINSALDGLRWMRILGMYPFSWLPYIGVPSIPYLAQGAVVPPNREFMAMLGDNKSETEVVSPLSTMEKAMENVLRRANGKQTIVINVDGKKLFEVMVDQNNSTVKRTGMSPLKV